MIEGSTLSESQRDLALRIFHRLAEAEAKVHGTTIEKVHFHEVGAVDSIADIVGSAIAWDLLGVERVVCSPIPTGTGFVEIAHGRCAIPAPATGELLRGMPLAASEVEGELTTPTGAAIVATLAQEFGPVPAMTIESIGYGAGQKDFEHPNLLRLLVGEIDRERRRKTDAIVLLETNLDDATGEAIGTAPSNLWKAGALDVSTSPLQMKKGSARRAALRAMSTGRRGTAWLRSCSAKRPTLGLRRSTLQRLTLPRQAVTVATPGGMLTVLRPIARRNGPFFARV